MSWEKYGLPKTCPPSPEGGDAIRYRITNNDGRQFEFNNFYLPPKTYRRAFREAGFRDFCWFAVSVHLAKLDNPFWQDFVDNPPVVPFSVCR